MKNLAIVLGIAMLAVGASADNVQDLTGVWGNVHFGTNVSNISAADAKVLQNAADHLKSDPNLIVECAGFADNRGSDAMNMRLSTRRAQAVRSVLVRKYGADPKRVIAKGYGEQFPTASNDTEDGRAKNRRVEVRAAREPNTGTAYPVSTDASLRGLSGSSTNGKTNTGTAYPQSTGTLRDAGKGSTNTGTAYPGNDNKTWN